VGLGRGQRPHRAAGTPPICTTLFLVAPGERFRAPPRLDRPKLREAYDQGARDAAARWARPKPVSAEALDPLATLSREAQRAYWLGARREPVQAPLPLRLEAALLVLEGLVIGYGADVHGVRQILIKGPPLLVIALLTGLARKRIEQRRARELGLSTLNAPQPAIGGQLLVLALAVLPCRLYRRHRRGIVEREGWPLMLARMLVMRFVTRRSWQRAMRAGR
jgi:hypothetical protein